MGGHAGGHEDDAIEPQCGASRFGDIQMSAMQRIERAPEDPIRHSEADSRDADTWRHIASRSEGTPSPVTAEMGNSGTFIFFR